MVAQPLATIDSFLKISSAPANSSNSCANCFEELTLKNKLIEVKEKFRKKQLALDVIKFRLIDLRRRVQQQDKAQYLFCEVCSKAVAANMVLQHICREKVIFLPCEYCNEPYSSTEKMLRHLKVAHSDAAQKYECQTCQKTFYMKLLYDFHQQKVHNKQTEIIGEPTTHMEYIVAEYGLPSPKSE